MHELMRGFVRRYNPQFALQPLANLVVTVEPVFLLQLFVQGILLACSLLSR
jgi:hypothetical protein